jgi:hypothetical protein
LKKEVEMTAEIAVMNTIGIALAADSAVTIGSDAKKIFTSSDKLFQLSSQAPVGIMTYGNAAFMGVPWETIIKEFRNDLGARTFDRVDQYAKKFISFVERRSDIVTPQSQRMHSRRLITAFLLHVREDRLKPALDLEAKAKGGLHSNDLARVIGKVLSDLKREVTARARLATLGPNPQSKIKSQLGGDIETIRKRVFGKLPLDGTMSRVLATTVIEVLCRDFFGPLESGLVFAGFGDSEFMPTLHSYDIECMANRRLRYVGRQKQAVTAVGLNASIVPFAQQEVVDAFMRGIDSNVREVFERSTSGVFNGVVGAILTKVAEKDQPLAKQLKKALDPGIKRMLSKLFDDWSEATNQHWRPVIDIVATLPKDELAAMAEALVNLTKFRRRVTPARETVGGPIDVAVITKGDGFVWMKRKHYFDPHLNPRVMARLTGAQAA